MKHYWIQDDGEGGVMHFSDAHPYMLLSRPEITVSGGKWSVRPAREYNGVKNYTDRYDMEAEAQAGYELCRKSQRSFHLSNLSPGDLERMEAEWEQEFVRWRHHGIEVASLPEDVANLRFRRPIPEPSLRR